MATMLYTVLAASGGWVAGAEVAIGAEIPLTEAEARYEIDLGTVAPTGREPPIPPLPPALLPTDLLETRRDRADRDVVLAALDAYLVRDGGPLLALLEAREAALAGRLTAQGSIVAAVRAEILGGAPAEYGTLAKLATALAGKADADQIAAALADKADKSALATQAARTFRPASGTAGVGQMAFPTANYSPGRVQVVLNGAVLPPDEYTELGSPTVRNGIQLREGLYATDVLVVVTQQMSGVQDAVTASAAQALAVATADAAVAAALPGGVPRAVRRSQLLRAVSQGLPGGLTSLLDAGLVSPSPDDAVNIAFYHEPFALPGGVLADLLTTYCRTTLGMSAPAAAAQVASLFATAATLNPGT